MTFEEVIEKNVTQIGKMLVDRGEDVATAESCTAGLVAYGLTSLAGSSDYFKQGWVVYQTRSKRTELVLPQKIEVYSAECAQHLAMACKTKACTGYGIGVTGKTEPDKGIVWFAVATPYSLDPLVNVRKYKGDRNSIRTAAANDIIKYFASIVKRQI